MSRCTSYHHALEAACACASLIALCVLQISLPGMASMKILCVFARGCVAWILNSVGLTPCVVQVNGSSHTNLTPYWAKELGKTQLTTIMCSPRSGRLLLEDRPDVGKVMLGGDVFVTRSGTIHVPMAVLQ